MGVLYCRLTILGDLGNLGNMGDLGDSGEKTLIKSETHTDKFERNCLTNRMMTVESCP